MAVFFISKGNAQVELTHYDDDATCSVICRSVVNKSSQISNLFHRRRKDQGFTVPRWVHNHEKLNNIPLQPVEEHPFFYD